MVFSSAPISLPSSKALGGGGGGYTVFKLVKDVQAVLDLCCSDI